MGLLGMDLRGLGAQKDGFLGKALGVLRVGRERERIGEDEEAMPDNKAGSFLPELSMWE